MTKSKQFTFGLIFLLALIGVLTWKFWPMEDARPVASAPRPTLLQTAAPPKPPPGIIVEVPKIAPMPARALPAASGATTSTSANPELSANPRAALDTLLPAFIQNLQENDLAHVLQTYLPPDELQKLTSQLPLAEVAKRLEASPDNQRRMESLMQTLLSIQNQTPAYFSNETGEYARYTLDPPIGGLDAAVFAKINGLWYYTTFF